MSPPSGSWFGCAICSTFQGHEDVNHFVVDRYTQFVTKLLTNTDGKALAHEAMLNFARLTEVVLPHLNTPPTGLIVAFYKSVTFTSELSALRSLGKLFPKQYQDFIDDNSGSLRCEIVELIVSDAEFFGEDGDELAFELLVDQYMGPALRMVGLRVTRKLIGQVYHAGDMAPPWRRSRQDRVSNADSSPAFNEDAYDA